MMIIDWKYRQEKKLRIIWNMNRKKIRFRRKMLSLTLTIRNFLIRNILIINLSRHRIRVKIIKMPITSSI